MTEPDDTREPSPADSFDLIEHRGYTLRIIKTSIDWVVFIARAGERPSIIVAPDREGATEKAREWVEMQLAAGHKKR